MSWLDFDVYSSLTGLKVLAQEVKRGRESYADGKMSALLGVVF